MASSDGAAGEGGTPLDVGGDTPLDASITAGAGGRRPHLPANHRGAAATPASPCPTDRGAGVPANSCVVGLAAQCTADCDCTSGVNGRCLTGGSDLACNLECSYDTCTADSDCPDKVPCACRSSPTDSKPNACATGSNCQIDSDCGPGGYCSRSAPDDGCNGYFRFCGFNCGRGYFCHTPKDTCTDDTDCNGDTCMYDLDAQSWACGAGACA